MAEVLWEPDGARGVGQGDAVRARGERVRVDDDFGEVTVGPAGEVAWTCAEDDVGPVRVGDALSLLAFGGVQFSRRAGMLLSLAGLEYGGGVETVGEAGGRV